MRPGVSSAWPSVWLLTCLLRRAHEKSGDGAGALGQFACAGVVAAESLGHGGHGQSGEGVTGEDLPFVGDRLDTGSPVDVCPVVGILSDQGIVAAINRAGVEAYPNIYLPGQPDLGPVDVANKILDDERDPAGMFDGLKDGADGIAPCVNVHRPR